MLLETLLIFMVTIFNYYNKLSLMFYSYVAMIAIWSIYKISKDNIFDIDFLFFFIMCVYNIIIPINYFFDFMKANNYFYLAYDYIIVKKHLLLLSIYSYTFIIGTQLFIKTNINLKRFINNDIISLKKNSMIILLLIEYLGVFMFFLGIHKLGGIEFLKSEYKWDLDRNLEIGMLTTGFQLACSIIIIRYYLYIKMLKKDGIKFNLFTWKDTYIMLLLIFIKIFQGNRLQILYLLVSLLLIYNIEYKKLNLSKLIKVTFMFLIFFSFVGYFREIKRFSSIDINTLLEYILGGSQNLEFFFNSYTNLTTIYVVENFEVKYLKGLSFLDGIIFLVPRVIFNNKDDFINVNKWIKTYSYYLNISPVGGLNILSQIIINFGYLYGTIAMFILGYVLSKINYYQKNKNTVLLYALLLPYILSFVRNPIHITFKEVFQFAILPFILYNVLINKNYKNISQN